MSISEWVALSPEVTEHVGSHFRLPSPPRRAAARWRPPMRNERYVAGMDKFRPAGGRRPSWPWRQCAPAPWRRGPLRHPCVAAWCPWGRVGRLRHGRLKPRSWVRVWVRAHSTVLLGARWTGRSPHRLVSGPSISRTDAYQHACRSLRPVGRISGAW